MMNIRLVTLFFLLALFTLPASAQVSVTATAGTTGPTAYTTVKGAFDAINVGTHTGNIIITINANTTETATAGLNVSGIGAANYTAVLIKPGAGTTPVINGAIIGGPVIKLNGSNNVTIDGSNNGTASRDLTIRNTSTSSSNVLVIGSAGSTPITQVVVKNTLLINGANTSTAVIVGDAAVPGNPGYFRNVTLQNNSIQKAYIGIYMYALVTAGNGSGTIIDGNDLNATGANAIRLVGIYCQGVAGVNIRKNNIGNFETANAEFDRGIWVAAATTNCTIADNTISNLGYTGTSSYAPIAINIASGVAFSGVVVQGNTITGLSSSGTGTAMGIFSYSSSTGVVVSGNKISNIKNTNAIGSGAAGILLAATITSAGSRIYNNFIWDIAGAGKNGYGSADNGNGIVVDGGGGYIIDFNTVVLTPDATLVNTSHRASALLITSNVTAGASIILRNNILANLQTTGDAVSRFSLSNVAGPGAGVFTAINNNDYYSLSGNLTSSGTNASITTTLAQVQTALGGNTNSRNVLPVFVGPNDLHLTGNNPLLIGAATPVSGILTDIDKETRDVTTPDIGADEIICTPISVSDNVTICAGQLPYTWNGQNIGAGGTAVATYTMPSLVTGCDSTTTLNLVVNPLKTATQSITICASQLPYTWNGQNIAAGGTAVATYTAPSLVTGCDSTTTLDLIVNQAPVITAQPTPVNSIVGGNATFTVTASGTAPLTYQWEVNSGSGFIAVANGGVYSNAQTPALTISGATLTMDKNNYRCVVSGVCAPAAASNDALLTVTQQSQTITFQSSTINSPLTVIYGDPLFSAAANASSGLPVTYTSNNTGVVTVNAAGLLTFTGAGTAVITIEQSGNGSYLPATPLTLSVQVNKKDLLIKADDKTRPYGDVNPVLTLSASGFVNGENLSVLSSPSIQTLATPLTSPGNYPIELTGGSAANYNLVLTNGTLTVTGAVVNINQEPADRDICEGQPVTFETGATAASLLVTPTYQWQQSNNGTNWRDIPGAVNAVYTANANSSMYIHCIISAPGTTLYTRAAIYNVRPLPNVRAHKAALVDCTLGGIQLNATGAVTYQWTPANGLTNPAIANPVANPGNTTSYVVEGFSSNGCSAKDSIQVALKVNNYPIANAFTPNGDGKNDCFGIRSWSVAIQKIEFSIFNRAGARVFHTNNPNDCWDGRFNGVLQPSDAFVYYIKAVTACGLIERKGTIMLIR